MPREPLTIDAVEMMIQAHMRSFAARADEGDASPEEKLRSVTLEFLRLVDGKVDGLPRFTLLAQPHPDDIGGPEPHFGEEALSAGLSDRYLGWDGQGMEAETGPDGAYTPEGMEALLFAHLRALEGYWLRDARTADLADKMDGVAFSIFSALHGSGMALPGFDYEFETPASVAEWREGKGLRPLPESGVISTHMHEGYHRAVSPDQAAAPEEDGPGPL